MLYHLHKEGATYVVMRKIPVIQGYKPLGLPASYHQLDIGATKAIASLISGANGNEPDLTKHPWALLSIWRLATPEGITVILEWQPASTVLRIVTIGNVASNVPPIESSSTPSSAVAEFDETASILSVIPSVDYI